VVDLDPPRHVHAIALTTDSPGMAIEIYGATGKIPALITDPAWVHLATRRAVKPSTTITLDTLGLVYDHLLVWIVHAPAGTTAGRIGISEVSVKP
jgi:hypothetical protein